MINNFEAYQSPSMISEPLIRESLQIFIKQTLGAFSTPDSNASAYFSDPDIVISGSGLDEYFIGPEAAQSGIKWVTTLGIRWDPQLVVSWMHGDIAWAQIRINGHKMEDGVPAIIPYVATGIFRRSGESWTWLYWGGSEPQKEPRL